MGYPFFILPEKRAQAAENMLDDWSLLKLSKQTKAVYFRHYTWDRPSCTFGYMQSLSWVSSQVNNEYALFRRPTGGGIVDHTADWTYTLVVPKGHFLCQLLAGESYSKVHGLIADALSDLGVACMLKPEDSVAKGLRPTVCFQQPEAFDVIDPKTDKKLAGAAQKRTQEGLLIQGSILIPETINKLEFKEEFVQKLTIFLNETPRQIPFPEFLGDAYDSLRSLLFSSDWNAKR